MKVRLELAHKKAKVKKVLLNSDTIIGRSTECGLRIASNEVSRQHCKICIGEDGVTVRDLGSSNGTFVNGYQLEPETDYEIAPDSELSLGGIKFFVRFSEPAAKALQADGLGSTVDLKPDQFAALEETVSLVPATDDSPAEAAEEDVEFAEAEPLEAGEETAAEAQADVDAGTVPLALPIEKNFTSADESDVEMSTHGDSAILERDDEVTEAAAAEELIAAEDIVDLELETDALEPISQLQEGEAEIEAEPAAESEDVVYEAEDEIEEAGETPDETEAEAGEEDVVFEEEEEDEVEEREVEEEEPELETAETEVAERASAAKEMDEDDVAAFLNQVAEEDAGAADDDESLGDFFQQFDK